MKVVRLDRRGTLYEIPLLIMFLGVALAIGLGTRSWWKGPLFAFLILGGILGGLVLLGLAADKLEEVPWVGRMLEWRLWSLLGAALAYFIGVAGGGAGAAFVSMFLAPALFDAPARQLSAMQVLTLMGAAGGGYIVWKGRREGPRF